MLRDALLDALAILVPVDCAGCGAPDRGLCPACRLALAPHPAVRVLPDGTPVTWSLAYDGAVRETILAFKEKHRTDVARFLAPALTAALGAAVSSQVRLATMPVSRDSYRRRGYDPVRTVLRSAGVPVPPAVLRNVVQRGEQKRLGVAARAENLAGTMRAMGDIRGRGYVLVDDVMTTGATLMEAAWALREGGGQVLAAAVIASTPKLSASKLW